MALVVLNSQCSNQIQPSEAFLEMQAARQRPALVGVCHLVAHPILAFQAPNSSSSKGQVDTLGHKPDEEVHGTTALEQPIPIPSTPILVVVAIPLPVVGPTVE